MSTQSPHWWQQPLLHFVLIGALIFAVDAWRTTDTSAPSNEVHVSALQVERLASLWEQRRGLPPTEDELAIAIQDFVREEIYYREALKLGLDRNDAVIRRRLQQKLEFSLMGDIPEPTDEQLEAHYLAHADRYSRGPIFHFEQLYLGEAGQMDEPALAAAIGSVDDEPLAGRPINLPRAMSRVEPADIRRIFGQSFAAAIEGLPADGWQGPVESGFGLHLVRVLDRQPAAALPFSQVRLKVAGDWRAIRRQEAQAAVYNQLRAGYDVVIEAGSQ